MQLKKTHVCTNITAHVRPKETHVSTEKNPLQRLKKKRKKRSRYKNKQKNDQVHNCTENKENSFQKFLKKKLRKNKATVLYRL